MIKCLPHLLVLIILSIAACDASEAETEAVTEPENPTRDLPADLRAVLDAHGGLDAWNAQRQLSYTFTQGDKTEEQVVDLANRREYIKNDEVEMGYDGERVWYLADTATYKGNPAFYRGLMFYFYAMPWVLADPGINYAEAEPLTFAGREYPGIHISYDNGVGESPEDEYFLHYDPDSKEMRWLGYTVTYFSGAASDEISYINYPSWSTYEGVALPDSLVWYTVEEGVPVAPRGTRVFTEVRLSKDSPKDARFTMPEEAEIAE